MDTVTDIHNVTETTHHNASQGLSHEHIAVIRVAVTVAVLTCVVLVLLRLYVWGCKVRRQKEKHNKNSQHYYDPFDVNNCNEHSPAVKQLSVDSDCTSGVESGSQTSDNSCSETSLIRSKRRRHGTRTSTNREPLPCRVELNLPPQVIEQLNCPAPTDGTPGLTLALFNQATQVVYALGLPSPPSSTLPSPVHRECRLSRATTPISFSSLAEISSSSLPKPNTNTGVEVPVSELPKELPD